MAKQDSSTQGIVTGNAPENGSNLAPATSLFTWLPHEGVKLRIPAEGDPKVHCREPLTVPKLFSQTVQKFPNKVALAVKRNDKWIKWTYAEYLQTVRIAAKAMIKLGVEPYHGVGIIGFNSPEWFFANLGAIYSGAFSTGIYTTNNPEACHYVAENSRAQIIFVEDVKQLQKILKIRDSLPHLKAIVQYQGELSISDPAIYNWEGFMQIGRGCDEAPLEERITALKANKCCTLIYTSGTTGNPKGVMLSHDNLTWTAVMTCQTARLVPGQEVGISFLPLSHIAAQIVDIYMPLSYGLEVWFAQPDALKGSLGSTIKEVRPTCFLAVPRVWEKMQEKMMQVGQSKPAAVQKLARWAKRVGLKSNYAQMRGQPSSFSYGVAKTLIFKKIRKTLGLDRCKLLMSAAAPMSKETLEYFMSIDMPICEIYGMSESTGPHTVSFPWRFKIGSVGVELPGVETHLLNCDQDNNGEICMNGRHVFMGYLNMEEKTSEDIDEMGRLHSGDVGARDADGFIHITGRIKELLITAGGENLAPVPIEERLKAELVCVSNCMLVGDKRKFMAMLITLKTETDQESGMPLDQLNSVSLGWCREQGSQATVVSQILDLKDVKVLKAIQAGIDKVNEKAISRAQYIQKWSLLPRDFSIPGGELGPTLKLKRPVVMKMYESTISSFYA